MREGVTVEVIVNEFEVIEMLYDEDAETLYAPGINFTEQGLFIGATVQILQGVNTAESTIVNITGASGNTIVIDISGLGFLTDDTTYTDIIIRLKDAPTYIRWDYGLIRDDVASDGDSNYASPLDANPQSYYKTGIVTPSTEFLEMIRFGIYQAWDLTDSIAVAFTGTVGDYYHTYVIHHSFIISPFRDGEQSNVVSLTKPDDLAGTHTYKYARRLTLGFSSSVIGSVTSLGTVGDVGYFHENYNGKANNFAIDSVTIINEADTGTINVNDSNDVTIVITSAEAIFVQPQKIVLWMLRCPAAAEYENNVDETWETVFIWDSLIQEAGQAEIDSDFITDLLVVYDDPDQITITFTVQYSTDQQAKISEGDRYIIGIALGQDGLDPDDEDNVTLRYTGLYSKNSDLSGLVDRAEILLHDSFAAYAGNRAYTDQKTWNGCWIGGRTDFELTQYNDGKKTRIKKAEFRLVLVKDDEYAVLAAVPIAVYPSSDFPSSGYSFQLVDTEITPYINLPSTEELNDTIAQSVPAFGPGVQAVLLQGALRVPWRDWVANPEIPISFFDNTEPNNNLNQKTSNYSGVDGYAVFAEFYLEVEYTPLPVEVTIGGLTLTAIGLPTTTVYKIRSNEVEVLDFNDDGNPSAVFTHTIELFDEGGTPVSSFSTTLVRIIKITVTHDQGTLSLQDIYGEIWIEPENYTGEPYQLHSEKNWNISGNILTGSQEVDTANVNFVEKESNDGEVILWCKTNPANMTSGISYIPYFRLGKQTD